jgi:hypothetical protein
MRPQSHIEVVSYDPSHDGTPQLSIRKMVGFHKSTMTMLEKVDLNAFELMQLISDLEKLQMSFPELNTIQGIDGTISETYLTQDEVNERMVDANYPRLECE